MDNIDFVVTWVDGSDPAWLLEKSKFSDTDLEKDQGNDERRYRPMDNFKYWFRAVEQYAPWVNKIFFVTYGHLPSWLDTSHPKLRIVKHEDYIPKEYLPTYSSNVIELNLYKIPDLSEHFVLFSDDVFLNDFVKVDDFFKKGFPRLFSIYRPIIPQKSFNHTELNNIIVINKYFYEKKCFKKNLFKFFSLQYGKFNLYNFFSIFYNGVMGYYDAHVALPSLKSTYSELWNNEYDLFHETCLRKFRSEGDINHWLISYWNIESNKFYPQKLNIGKYVPLSNSDKIISILKNKIYKSICINDDEHTINFTEENVLLEKAFLQKFPNKSSFEK